MFLVGYIDGEPVASGGWRARDADASGPALRDGDAEVKRMFLAAQWRKRGLAEAVLAALEDSITAAGRTRVIVETDRALHLGGYARMPSFGHYRTSPLSRCFAKSLPA